MDVLPVPRLNTPDPRKRAALLIARVLINDTVRPEVAISAPGETRFVAASIYAAFDTLLALDHRNAKSRFEARGALIYFLKALYCEESRLGDLLSHISDADPVEFAQGVIRLYQWSVHVDLGEAQALCDEYSLELTRRRQRGLKRQRVVERVR